MNKILITGGLGYIGSKLIRLINNLNYSITVLDNKIFNQDVLKDIISNKKINLYLDDVRNKKVYEKLIKENDIIIPLAGLVGAPICSKYPKLAREINLDAVKFLVSKISKDQKIIFPVTNSGYGIGKPGEYCDENSELNPISIYGKTKVEAEKYVRSFENSVCFRLATVFGVSDRVRTDLLVNDFTYIAYTKKFIRLFQPHFRRNYVHVEDVAKCMIFALDNFQKLKSEVYNFGLSTANLTKEQLCKKIQEHIQDFKYEISKDGEDPDKRDYFVSNEKLEKKGFKATISLDYGIKELIKVYSDPNSILSNNQGEIFNVKN
tara:strand:- start:512 stop:1471 length:960 start_codon:yes stop_codon:yes gene_type:complete